jgi:MoxR-like ATPase
VSELYERVNRLRENVNKAIVGQEEIVTTLITGLLANGNILVEGLPGLAKTRAIKALADHLEGTFGRIQFTPDMVSQDIVGRFEYVEHDGERVFEFVKGPVFNNVVLADEINRAPSKTQNSLLEAMEERQVTAGGVSYKMPDLFMVMATMNPVDQEGTFKLPEAQLDRFLMHISVFYPDEEAEQNIIRLVRAEQSQKARQEAAERKEKKEVEITTQETIFQARGEIDHIKVSDAIERYIIDIIFATRYPGRISYDLKAFCKMGASPRASLGIDRCARAHAWLHGREEVTVEDVRAVLKPVLRHRIVRGKRAIEHNATTDDIIAHLIEVIQPSKDAPWAETQ